MLNQKKSSFLFVLGGRAKKANVELNAVRWVIGSKIEDTYDSLRRDYILIVLKNKLFRWI